MRRNAFLTAAGASIVGLSAGKSGRAAAPANVPTVDRLVVTNVVDNLYDIFIVETPRSDVTVRRTLQRLGQPSLLSQHGLAMHVESVRGDEHREVLLDFALTGDVLAHDYSVLGIDPTRADALVISHGHSDHWGGFADLENANREHFKPALTLYAGGDDTFCHRVIVNRDQTTQDMGQFDRKRVEGALKVAIVPQPATLVGHAATSGQIPRRTDFETTPASWSLLRSPGDLCGASPDQVKAAQDHFAPTQVANASGTLIHDTMQGEFVPFYHVKGRGLVILLSCGHAGTINTVRWIQEISGVEKVHAIVGGMHLAPAPDDVISKTVDALAQINPDYIAPMHCTGYRAATVMRQRMPGKVIDQSTGTRFVFGA